MQSTGHTISSHHYFVVLYHVNSTYPHLSACNFFQSKLTIYLLVMKLVNALMGKDYAIIIFVVF